MKDNRFSNITIDRISSPNKVKMSYIDKQDKYTLKYFSRKANRFFNIQSYNITKSSYKAFLDKDSLFPSLLVRLNNFPHTVRVQHNKQFDILLHRSLMFNSQLSDTIASLTRRTMDSITDKFLMQYDD